MRPPLVSGKGKHDKKIIAFVDKYWRTQFRPPSIREIGAACGVSSTCSIKNTLERIATSGDYIYIDKDARGIIPVWVTLAIKKVNSNAS